MKGFNTKLLHSPHNKPDIYGSLQAPLYASSAFEFDTAEDLEAAFKGIKPAHVYSRSSNPTVELLELRMKSIGNGVGAAAFASGMAAISAVVFSLCKSGDNVVTTNKLFGNTYSLFENTLKPYGIEFRYVDFTKPDLVVEAIDKNTRLLFAETINNPQLEVIDIAAIAKIAKEKKVIFCADTTLTPPCTFDAGSHGIDISVISSTKYISSGAATLGGIVIDHGKGNWQANPKLAQLSAQFGNLAFFIKIKKEILRNMGGCMSPFNAYMQLVGSETMSLRFQKMSENALEIAEWLEKHPKVKKVTYPGLKSSPFYQIAFSYFTLAGGLLTFDLASQKECYTFMNKLNLIKRATNLNDNKSLIIHPASTIYAEFTHEIIRRMEVRDTMMRFSIGIEDAEDIIDDLKQALE